MSRTKKKKKRDVGTPGAPHVLFDQKRKTYLRSRRKTASDHTWSYAWRARGGSGPGKMREPVITLWISVPRWRIDVGKERLECKGTEEPKMKRCLRSTRQQLAGSGAKTLCQQPLKDGRTGFSFQSCLRPRAAYEPLWGRGMLPHPDTHLRPRANHQPAGRCHSGMSPAPEPSFCATHRQCRSLLFGMLYGFRGGGAHAQVTAPDISHAISLHLLPWA